MLTNIESFKPKINMILHYILQYKLDICFTTVTWISNNEDLQYLMANLMPKGFNILLCERKKQKRKGLACVYNSPIVCAVLMLDS